MIERKVTAMTEIERRSDSGQIVQYNPPTPDQVVELLQLAAAYDKRTFGHAEKAAWTSAAEIGQWTHQEAAAAIRHHQATSTDYLTPAHITEWIRDQRRKRRLVGGTSSVTGMKFPSHQDAVDLWVSEMQRAGQNPTDAQMQQASSILAQMLDGAADPVPVLSAAVLAAREFSSRVDWRLERMAKDGISPTAMPPIPVEYIPDDRLNVHIATHHPSFPAEWREYNPFSTKVEVRNMSPNYFDEVKLPFAPTPREIPEWVVEVFRDRRPRRPQSGFLVDFTGSDEELRAEAGDYLKRKKAADDWMNADLAAWEAERLPVIRQWYGEHPEAYGSGYAPKPEDRPKGFWDN